MELQPIFLELAQRYTGDKILTEKLWAEIAASYTKRKRHYHNLAHLDNLLQELAPLRQSIQYWDTLLFSIFYHDAVYNVLKKDNEERSADLAKKRLQQIQFPAASMERCYQQILATKAHSISSDHDTNLFTDADLSILGKGPATYQQYCTDIRKEYSVYPDFMYKPGRKKVVEHFLQMERIYKTDYFFQLYEVPARANLQMELVSLLHKQQFHAHLF